MVADTTFASGFSAQGNVGMANGSGPCLSTRPPQCWVFERQALVLPREVVVRKPLRELDASQGEC